MSKDENKKIQPLGDDELETAVGGLAVNSDPQQLRNTYQQTHSGKRCKYCGQFIDNGDSLSDKNIMLYVYNGWFFCRACNTVRYDRSDMR